MLGVGVLYTTTDPRVTKNFLIACAIADIGHLWVTGAVMGGKAFVSVGEWNEMAWGNIGVTAFLFVSRVLYLAGFLGEDRIVRAMKEETSRIKSKAR